MSFVAGGILVTDPRGGTTVEAAQRDRVCPRSMAAVTNEHRLGAQRDRSLPSRSLEAGNPKSKCQQGWFFPEAPGEGLPRSSSGCGRITPMRGSVLTRPSSLCESVVIPRPPSVSRVLTRTLVMLHQGPPCCKVTLF